PGVLAYLDPNIFFWNKAEATKIGFDVTLIGMSAFIVGAMAARILSGPSMGAKSYQQRANSEVFARSARRVLVIGTASYFVVLPVSGLVPSLTAVTSVMGGFLILGIWFLLYSSRQALLIFAMLPLLPLSTLVTAGFIGYGTGFALSTLSFLFVIARRRAWFYLVTPAVVFLGLSLFVTYAQQRDEIRDVIWYQNA